MRRPSRHYSTVFLDSGPEMKFVSEKLFAVPISWLLAVPIVLLDRLLAPDLGELPSWNGECRIEARY
ncbi:hypothetical protein [Rhodococcus indonesiensis]|uniref:hypothetical protein n=1 Tax=Rhodococcus indonesiensis TaxID=3055869 RepID=UPI0039F6BB6A